MTGSPSDDALRYATEAHYLDAKMYDHAYARRKYDVKFYVQIAREIGEPILELGAGSGRIAIALARDANEVVAVDRMSSMLDRLRERLARQPRVVRKRLTIVKGDITTLRLRRKFPLVIAPFNVLMHMYTRPQLEKALATCRAHMRPRGRLVLDVLMPDVRAFVRDPTRAYVARPIVDPNDGRKWGYSEQFQFDPVTQIQMVTSVLRNPDDPSELRVLPLAHRQFFPAELEALLHYNGLSIVERWGDFERRPLSLERESQIIVAKLRR